MLLPGNKTCTYSNTLVAVCVYRLVMTSIKWSETAQKNALASADVIVTQLLRYHMPLLYCMQPFNYFWHSKGIKKTNHTIWKLGK